MYEIWIQYYKSLYLYTKKRLWPEMVLSDCFPKDNLIFNIIVISTNTNIQYVQLIKWN